ncbi:hypothetical protein YC2023_122807 [Brassica napus]
MTLQSCPARSDEATARFDEATKRYDEATARSYEAAARSDEATTISLTTLRNANKGQRIIDILKIDEVGELFEEVRGTQNKNVVCEIKELQIYKAL